MSDFITKTFIFFIWVQGTSTLLPQPILLQATFHVQPSSSIFSPTYLKMSPRPFDQVFAISNRTRLYCVQSAKVCLHPTDQWFCKCGHQTSEVSKTFTRAPQNLSYLHSHTKMIICFSTLQAFALMGKMMEPWHKAVQLMWKLCYRSCVLCCLHTSEFFFDSFT